MPAALVAKIEKAQTFNTGFTDRRVSRLGHLDMKVHLAGGETIDPDKFEKDDAEPRSACPRRSSCATARRSSGHIFSGEGYAAGYYSYLWAKVLDHDAFEAFQENGGPFNPQEAKRYHDDVLSVGNTIDPAVAYRNFRGRDATIDAYLRAKGFPLPDQAAPAKASPRPRPRPTNDR